MDTFTQGLLGAAAAQALLGHRLGARTWLYGAVGGMAADLDVFIRSSTDPLVGWIYHRHFTHSFAFVPVGGVLSALPWILRERYRENRWTIVAATTAGYATHALLDAFTSYGTMLYWPFSDARVAWNSVSIIDLLFSVPLGWGVVRAARQRRRRPAVIALLWCALYLGFGAIQHSRAVAATRELAQSRGHAPERVDAFPGAFTNFVWRTAYEVGDTIYIDQARTPWWSATRTRAGGSVHHPERDEVASAVGGDPELLRAYDVFAWFADGWVGADPRGPLAFGDLRYGQELDDTTSMWGLELHPAAPPGSRVQALQRSSENFGARLNRRWRILLGDPDVAP